MTEIGAAVFYGSMGAGLLVLSSMVMYKIRSYIDKCELCKMRIGTGSNVSENGVKMHYDCWKTMRLR